MKKTAYKKDNKREITHSFGRFICIFLIVALGVAFFTGIRVCEPDMQKSADELFDKYDLMDIEIISTGGITDDDVDALTQVEGVRVCMPGYSADALESCEGEQNVIKVISMPTQLNRIRIVEGRMPESDNECLLDRKLTSYYADYAIGDTISLDYDCEEDEDEPLRINEFTIVGFVTSPLYLDFSRGSSSLGSGSVLGFIYVPADVFELDCYTVAYVSVEGAEQELSYTDAYDAVVDKVIDRIEEIADERCSVREAELRDLADEELADAEAELEEKKADADRELADARAELDEAYIKLEDAEADIADGKIQIEENSQKLADAEAEIEENSQKLADAREELDEKWDEYYEGKKPVDEAREALIAFKQQIEDAKRDLDAGREFMSVEDIMTAEGTIAYMEAQVPQAESDYADALILLKEARSKLEVAEEEYADGLAQLEDARIELEKGRDELADAQKELEDGIAELEDAKKEIEEGEQEYADAVIEADEKISDAREEIDSARKDIDTLIDTPVWYVLSRDYITSVAEFGGNSEKIGAIGKVFPVIFFLVAILVCLTTMTRMVEEERTQIGTMKALGYTDFQVAWKFIRYCLLASVSGSIFGAVFGEYILPYCIINAYYILYNNIPYLHLGIDLKLSLLAGIIACSCTLFATLLACGRTSRECAAELMRPVAPMPGKRVFIERIGFVWKRLTFTAKASARNLLRYQKRFWMTVIGIGGCTALMLVGFGLHDSIFTIIDNQFYKIMKYDGMISLNSSDEEAVDELVDYVNRCSDVDSSLRTYQTSTNAGANDTEKEAYLVVPQYSRELNTYIYMGDRVSDREFSFAEYDDGVVINEKLASLLDVNVGDTMYVTDEDGLRINVVISAITENYVYNYVYMSPEIYEASFGETPEYNVLLFMNTHELSSAEETDFGRRILGIDAASGISFSRASADTIYDMMSSLNFVVYVLVTAAALLAFVVLYNLTNINVNERRRELATLKVLGFYDTEVSAYVYRENVILTIIGAAFGVVFGIFLHRYVILTAEVDMTLFGRQIKPMSFLYSIALTFVFAVLVNIVMHFKLKRIDMVESLKGVE